jgi:hypothetical protein
MNVNPFATIPNPFRQTIVKDAWESLQDVPEIHAQAFETCCRAYENVRTSRRCDSVLLHGGAGSGKTHLLSRLQRHWTTSTGRGGPDEIGRCVFLYCRLQTSPHRLWQHLRKTFVEDLLHRFPDGTTQLQRLVACRFAEGDRKKRRPAALWLKWITNPANRDHAGWKRILLPWLEREAHIGFSLQRVLYHLITGHHVLEAGAWLKGEDRLPEESVALMGISENEEGQTEDGAREMVLALCRLASPLMPVAFCFDQIEALQTSKDDEESLFLFGQMGASLFNSSNNALLISCIQSYVVEKFKASIREADFDRIAQRSEALDPLDKRLAHLLIQRRLEWSEELGLLRAKHPHKPLWPIEAADLDSFFGSSAAQTARKIISLAGALFDKVQTGEAPPRQDPVDFLSREFTRRRDAALAQDETESDATLAHGLPLLAEALGGQWRKERPPDKDIDLLLSHGDKRIAVSLCNHQNMRSLAARLKRLMDWHSRNKGAEMVLIRDGRLHLGKAAMVTKHRLESLKSSGVSLCRPDAETLAALQALRSLISDARSGDLHDGGEAIGPKKVEEWLFQNLDSRLTAFFGQIVGASEPPEEADSELMNSILEVLKKRKVIELEKLAEEIRQTPPLIEDVVKRYPGRIGCLQGPPAVLFDYRPVELLSSGEEDAE